MAQLKRSVRALVRLAYGKGLPRGSRNDAVQSYIRAVELSPQKLVNRYPEAADNICKRASHCSQFIL